MGAPLWGLWMLPFGQMYLEDGFCFLDLLMNYNCTSSLLKSLVHEAVPSINISTSGFSKGWSVRMSARIDFFSYAFLMVCNALGHSIPQLNGSLSFLLRASYKDLAMSPKLGIQIHGKTQPFLRILPVAFRWWVQPPYLMLMLPLDLSFVLLVNQILDILQLVEKFALSLGLYNSGLPKKLLGPNPGLRQAQVH